MANLLHNESRRLYSWWWDSHISPKNSKWLQENLTDMDSKVKAMIKLIEEDADSFARRAEMYYKKRPELMKLVEDFYRAYRALAERYDHATGALRQAQRTMAEAFPNQIPFVLTDESPSPSGTEMEPHTPEMAAPVRALFDSDDIPRDPLVVSPHFHVIKRKGAYSEENDALTSRKGLKQLNELIATGEGEACANFTEGRAKKVLNFQEGEGKNSKDKTQYWPRNLPNQESNEEDVLNETQYSEELSRLSTENQNLKSQIASESERADKAESEVQSLKDSLSKLNSEMEASISKYQQSIERISYLETQISHTQDDFKKLNDETVVRSMKLVSAEERCLLLEKANQSLQSVLNTIEQKSKTQQEELSKKQEELENLNISIQAEHQRCTEAEMALLSMEKLHSQSRKESKLLAMEIERGINKLKDMELRNAGLEEEMCQLKEENGSLNEQKLSSSLKIKNLQHEINILEETRGKLEYEMGVYLEEKKFYQHELDFLKKDMNDLAMKYQGLMEEMDAVRLNAESLRAFAKELQDGNIELKEICKKHEDEKLLLLENLKNMEKILEKNAVLENSLSDANAEVEGLKEKKKTLEGSCESLFGQIISHISEKAVLVSQVETTAQNMEKLTEKNGFLENSLSDMNVDLEGLRGKLKGIEESYQSLYDQKTNLLAENNTLVSQVESIGQSLENLESRHADLKREKDLTLHQVMELEGFLKLEKQENETLTQSSKSQLATLENQIRLLREESRVREEEFEVEQHKVTSALVEIFILQRCLSDMKENNSILSNDCHKHLEASKCAEELISKLEQENLIQKKKMTSLFEHTEKLRQGILRLLRVLNINKEFGSSDGVNDEVLLQIIFAEIKKLLNSISDAQDGILHLQLETLVAVTILNQIGEDVKDKNDLEQRHRALREEMEAVSLNAESLRSLVKELQDGNVEMKEICKKHEDEKLLLLQKLKNMEKISEKNTVLENSLSDVNVELEGLREKIKTSEGSCESLHGQVVAHISEKAVLVSQVEINAQNIEKLMDKNAFLENSLSDMNTELEGLRGKLKDLKESYQSLCGEKANLLAENTTLVSQVESVSWSLENMESRYAELEDKHLHLERERDSTLHQIMELEVFMKQEKQEHETLTQSCKSQLATLNNQIRILREESRVREEEFKVEQNKIISALIEIFILQRCLSDMRDTNLNLSKDYHKHLEVSRCTENLVSQLEQEDILQKKRIMSLSEQNEKLRQGILLLFRALCINKEFGSTDGVKDEVLLKIIPGEIRNLLNSFSDAQDEIQHLQVEMLVVVANLKQIGLDVEDLRIEKVLLERELEIQMEELSISQSKNQETLELNEHLRQDVQIRGQLEEELKAEMETLHLQLSDLQQAHWRSQSEIRKLLDENQSLSEKNYKLREEKGALEEENSAVLVEAMALEHLYLLSRSSNAERALELKLCSDGMDGLRAVKSKLDKEIGILDEKLSVLDVENMHLKESAAYLEEYSNRSIFLEFDLNTTRYVCEELNHEIEAGKNLLVQKEMELSEANQKVQSLEVMNGELSRNLAGLNQDVDGAKVVREELENKVFSLSVEVEVLRSREEHLTSNLQKEKYEVEQCGMDIMALLNDVHISMVSAAIFEEKVFELMLACEGLEIFTMVQKEMLNEEITSRNVFIIGLKKKLDDMEGDNRELKTNLNAYLPLIMSLRGSIASVEEKTLSLAGLHTSNDWEKQDNSLVSHHQHDKSSPLREDHSTVVLLGFLELQKLIAKVEALEKVITDTGSFLEQERSDAIANSESARKEIEGLKLKLIEEGEEPGTNHKLQNDDTEITKTKYEQTTKDIQLDEVSSSSPYENNVGSYGLTRIESSETDDQMLELWEAAERDCKTGVQNTAPGALEHDVEAVEERKSEHPSSKLVAEKTLSITEVEESHQEWNRRVLESRASDARKLSVLQTSVQELQRRMECSEKSKRPKGLEFDTVKTKLEEAEGAILELIDLNGKLAENAEERHVSSNGMSRAQNEIESAGRRQISERVRRGSEKIGMLELELQKIQYILLKLEEEHENTRNRASDRSPKVLLREYLSVRRDKLRRKKGSLCGCMRPRTTGD